MKLIVKTQGVLGLVPRLTQKESEVEDALLVVPNLRRGLKDFPLSEGLVASLPPHLACLVVETRYVDPDASTKKPVLTYFREQRLFALYEFFDQALVLDVPQEKIKVSEGSGGEAPSEETPEGDLFWVPSMRQMKVKNANLLNKGALVENLLPGEGVVGTVLLGAGAIASQPVIAVDGEPQIYEFKSLYSGGDTGDAVHRQAAAPGITWEVNCPDSGVTLLWKRKGMEEETLRLKPVAGENTVPVRIANRELEDIIGVGEGSPPLMGGDPDMAALYTISAFWPDGVDPVPISFRSNGVGLGERDCYALQFDGIEE